MSRWKTNFDNQHALQIAQSSLDVLQGEKLKAASIPSPAKEEYDRAVKVLKLITVRLSTLDPELFHLNNWGNLSAWLNQAKSQGDAFVSNQNLGHIQNLNSQLDEILNLLRPIDSQFSDKQFAALTDVNERLNQKFLEVLMRSRAGLDALPPLT